MSRGLEPGIVAQLESRQIYSAYLVELVLEAGVVYLTSFPRNLEWNGKTYLSATTLGIEGITDSLSLQNNETSVSLSGISSTYTSLVLNEEYIGNEMTLRLFFYDPESGERIAEPYITHRGPVSESAFVRDKTNGTVSINLSLGSWFARFEDINGPRTNPTEWRKTNPNDEIFAQVPTLQEKELLF